MPLTIEIYDDSLAQFILEQSRLKEETPLQYVTRLAIEENRRNTQVELLGDRIEDVISGLRVVYSDEYKKRFGVDAPYENGEATRLMTLAITEMLKSGMSAKEAFGKLRNSITWYLNFHDNQDTNGQNFPYGIKYLFSRTKDGWLLRSCVESSYKLDDKVFKLIRSGLSREEAMRTIRRGDRAGSVKQESRVAQLDEALKLCASFRKKYAEHLPSNFKFHKKIDRLFKSETPSNEYIKEAIEWLNNLADAIDKR